MFVIHLFQVVQRCAASHQKLARVLKFNQMAHANYPLRLNVQHLGVLVVRAELLALIEDAKLGLEVVFHASLGVQRLCIVIGVR